MKKIAGAILTKHALNNRSKRKPKVDTKIGLLVLIAGLGFVSACATSIDDEKNSKIESSGFDLRVESDAELGRMKAYLEDRVPRGSH